MFGFGIAVTRLIVKHTTTKENRILRTICFAKRVNAWNNPEKMEDITEISLRTLGTTATLLILRVADENVQRQMLNVTNRVQQLHGPH